MVKKQKDWYEEIANPKSAGYRIIKEFFITFTTQEQLNQIIYSKELINPTIKRYYKKWDEFGFITNSRDIKVKNKKNKEQTTTVKWSLINLEFLNKYCYEKKDFLFTPAELRFLHDLTLPEHIRAKIINEFPKDDLIHAILKFYVKNFIIRYFNLLRDIRENPDKYIKEKNKVQELNHPSTILGKKMKKAHEKLLKQLNKEYFADNKKEQWDIIKSYAYRADKKELIEYAFQTYINQIENNPELIKSVDNKILKALDVLP